MGMKWWIRIRTATTTKKQLAIWKAQTGQLDTASLEYMQERYEKSLFWQIKEIFRSQGLPNVLDEDVRDICRDSVNDAFVYIKEYQTHKKFRTFLVTKVKYNLGKAIDEWKKRKAGEREYIERLESARKGIKQKLWSGFHKHLAAEFIKDALKRLKIEDRPKYEVFCYWYYEKLPYSEIVQKLKPLYPEVSSEVNARQMCTRAKKELKHITREIYKGDPDLARKLPFSKGLKNALGKETTIT
jgi:DNA-directed RNA polymerase specialized sigma24 family protein